MKESHELRIILIRDQGQLVFAAPLLKTRSKGNGLPVNCLTFIEHPESQRGNVLAAESYENADVFAAFLSFVLEDRTLDWNLLSLDKLPGGSQTARLLSDAATASGRKFETMPSHSALYIPLTQSLDAYLASRSPRFRKTLRNVTNRMMQLGPVELHCYTGSEATTVAFEKLCSVSASSWKAQDGIAITSQPARIGFFKEFFANEGNHVRIWILEADGVPIASETQLIDGLTIYALRSDYDERYAAQSPGSYLQLEILKRLFGGAFERYDFGVGINAYKTRWTENRESLVKWWIYNDTLYSRLLCSAEKYDRKFRRIPAMCALHGLVLGKSS